MRKQYKGYLFPVVLLTVLLIGLPGTGVVFAKAQNQLASHYKADHQTGGTWNIVPSPNAGSSANILESVTAISASDIWAVGDYFNSNIAVDQTLIEHWNGWTWSVVTSPNAGSSGNELYSVAAVGASNIWAVGYYLNTSSYAQTLIEHWNGMSWSVVPSPNVGSNHNTLYGVAAVSTNNIWAVGYYLNSSNVGQTLIEHWNGVSWSVVPSPNVGSLGGSLYSVAAFSENNVWTVGGAGNGQTLVECWNGTEWRVVPSPNIGSNTNVLSSVAGVSTLVPDVWAVGYYFNSSGVQHTLIEHWNGSQWSIVPGPNVDGYLYGATLAPGSSNVWAVGYYFNSSTGYQTLIEHWNGTSWSLVPSPNVSSSSNYLYGVAQVSGSSNVWAVGDYINNISAVTSARTLIEFYR